MKTKGKKKRVGLVIAGIILLLLLIIVGGVFFAANHCAAAHKSINKNKFSERNEPK